MDQVRRKTNATSAYQRHLTGKGVTVAFLDTGISMHPDLQGRILAFRDFQNGKKYPYDDSGHGTHVAGICCGSGQLSRGQYAGMAPGAGIVSAKVLDHHGNGMREQVLSSVSWILKNKNRYHIKILNVSVGAVNSLEEKNAVLAECMEYAWDAGLVVVVAAGNMGPHAGSVTVPGTNKKVIRHRNVSANRRSRLPDQTSDPAAAPGIWTAENTVSKAVPPWQHPLSPVRSPCFWKKNHILQTWK